MYISVQSRKKIYFLSGSIICELAQSTSSFQILFIFFWIGRMERMGGGSIVTLSRNLGPAYYFVIYLHLPLIHKYIMINLTYTFLHPYDLIFFLQIDCIRVFLKPVIPFILFSNNQIPSLE